MTTKNTAAAVTTSPDLDLDSIIAELVRQSGKHLAIANLCSGRVCDLQCEEVDGDVEEDHHAAEIARLEELQHEMHFRWLAERYGPAEAARHRANHEEHREERKRRVAEDDARWEAEKAAK